MEAHPFPSHLTKPVLDMICKKAAGGWRFDEYYVPIDVTDMNWMEHYVTPGKTT